MEEEKKGDKKTGEIDEIIQPYYQKANLEYQKEKNKKHISWDMWFLIFAIALAIYYILFD